MSTDGEGNQHVEIAGAGQPVNAGGVTVSAIIPTHDRPAALARAIESVHTQTVPAHEIIVVDNGETEVRLDDLPPRARVLRAPASIGASQARNIGATVASGTHLAFLDDDDTWTDDYLAQVVRALDREPGAPRCAAGALLDFGTRAALSGKNEQLPTSVRSWVRRNPGLVGSNLIVERALFLEIGGFDGSLRANEDIDFALRVIAAGTPITRIAGAIALYDAGHGGPRLTGWRNLTVSKYQLARKHLEGPFVPVLVSAEYGSRLLASTMRRAIAGRVEHRRQDTIRDEPPSR